MKSNKSSAKQGHSSDVNFLSEKLSEMIGEMKGIFYTDPSHEEVAQRKLLIQAGEIIVILTKEVNSLKEKLDALRKNDENDGNFLKNQEIATIPLRPGNIGQTPESTFGPSRETIR
jgi:hypothetical protein